ncbi:NmrA-like family protein [Nocardioides alpinus]|uniref:NmrA family protein n=1 Tax=Nocardioides alpinus TaxID=748909 RepID=A0A1I1B5E0_9ACTN|nr:NmrA family NAD(P)-binding protein [Nocardioides alpinus]PKH39618.1 NmrA family protein [Nocardioides alpinus]SFB44972.1 NmrA-like family protein [Nocardioides alpinus]
MSPTTIVVAGATGDLGGRIATALLARGASVRALLRPDADGAARDRLTAQGVDVVAADARDVGSVASACTGAACVVSALNGLGDVILDRQSVLIDAAVRAGVPRFIPSDFSADFTRTPAGRNRNFDLRREFMGRADRAPIGVTSILNGAFLELLDGDMPLIQSRIRRVLFWGDADQVLDFTAKDDVAAYTAAAALDPGTPRILRIAGDSLSVRDMSRILSDTTDGSFRPLRAGGLTSMSAMIGVAKRLAPGDDAVFPAWQGMQYTRDMFDGRVRLEPLDNDRYPDVSWTSVRDRFVVGAA